LHVSSQLRTGFRSPASSAISAINSAPGTAENRTEYFLGGLTAGANDLVTSDRISATKSYSLSGITGPSFKLLGESESGSESEISMSSKSSVQTNPGTYRNFGGTGLAAFSKSSTQSN
jgi:hypothetical protein